MKRTDGRLWSRRARRLCIEAAGCLCLVLRATGAFGSGPMSLGDYMALSGPEPTAHLAYGSARSQYVELFRPAGAGPFPVVLLVHGGCWRSDLAGIEQMRNIAGTLQAQGIAVWNVEYRRVDEEGGGYPGTYQDVSAALALLIASAEEYRLDTAHLLAMGHSAGGQLVQWLAGRALIAASSPLYEAHPFPVRQIIALGSIGDLRRRAAATQAHCGIDVRALTGRASASRHDVYSDTSPAELLPNGSHTVLINGELDTISSPRTASDFAARARKSGDAIDVLVLPRASHFDEVSATSRSWAQVLPEIRRALGMDATAR